MLSKVWFTLTLHTAKRRYTTVDTSQLKGELVCLKPSPAFGASCALHAHFLATSSFYTEGSKGVVLNNPTQK